MISYKRSPKTVKCPVCDANNAHLLWRTNSKEAAQHFVLQEKYPERFFQLVLSIENLWGQDTCDIVQCDKCRFCFSNPYIGGTEQFYTLAYERSGYPKWKWEFQLTYDVLNNMPKSDVRLLEIGAGDGAFIKKIAEKILPKEKIFCTEFSVYGKQQIEKFGVRCLSEDIRNIKDKELEESIDIICMFQVLEHMDSLDILFKQLNWLMKKGGSIFIAVPNHKRIEFNELNGALLEMPPNHIGRWNLKSFEEIAKQYNFQIEDYKVEESSFKSMVKQFIIYRFLRKSQISGSFENIISIIRNRYLLRIMQTLGLAINSITAIPSITKMNNTLGNSMWVHMKKI